MDPQVYRQSISLMIRTAYLYYNENKSQTEIAGMFNISVSTVSRLLNKAKKENIVQFVIQDKYINTVKLENDLKEKYGLEDVIVAQSLEYSNDVFTIDEKKKIVGLEGARYIQRIIGDNDILGITFGRTMYHMINYLNPCQKTDTQFVTLHGSISKIDHNFDVAPLVRRMAMSFGGKNYCIPSQGNVSTKELADALKQEGAIKEIFDKFKAITISVAGVGSFFPEKSSLLCKDDYFSKEELKEFDEKNIVADIALRLIDKDGKEIESDFKYTTIGISYEDYMNIPTKIIMVSGEYKKDSVHALLKNKMADVAIMDLDLANALIRMDN